MKEFDVIIVGGGPAGSIAAWQLGIYGFSVLLLEASDGKQRKICGEYLSPAGVNLLVQREVIQLIEGFEKLLGMNIYSPSGTKINCVFPQDHKDITFGVSVQRQLFDSRIRSLAQSNANVELLLNTRVRDLTFKEDRWNVTTGSCTYRTKLLIGADGIRSTVARSIGVRKIKANNRLAVHCFASSKLEREPYGEMHLYEDGTYLGINPINSRETNLGFVTDVSVFRKYDSAVAFLVDRICSDKKLSERYNLEFNQVKLTCNITNSNYQVVGERCALIGDAAGFVDPLTGEGITGALLSGLVLADSVRFTKLDCRKSLDQSLTNFANLYATRFHAKRTVNKIFQWLIKKPQLLELASDLLLARQQHADALVGLIGNIFTPLQALIYSLNYSKLAKP